MAALSAAIAMMEFSSHAIGAILIPVLFGLSSSLGVLGMSAQSVGKKYYRRTLDHLHFVIESLNTESAKRNAGYVPISAFRTTKGMMQRDDKELNVDSSGKISRGSFSAYLRYFFMAIAVTGACGAASSAIFYIHHYQLLEKLSNVICSISAP